MTKRKGKKKSPAKGVVTTGVITPVSQSPEPIATGSIDAAYWPELTESGMEAIRLKGGGGSLETVANIRLSIRAVRERYPVPPEMRERMVYDTWLLFKNSQDPKLKIWAAKLLLHMEAANAKQNNLPDQLAAVAAGGGNVSITVNQVLSMMGSDPVDLDMRDYKILPGSDGDYAE